MNLVIDSNIVFSTLLNLKSTVGELLMNADDDFKFFAPKLLIEEIGYYSNKIENYTKLNKFELRELKDTLFDSIEFIPEDNISQDNWVAAT